MKVLILAGGIGTRLWPLSRRSFPKQFLKLKKFNKSLFQMTFMRSMALGSIEDIFVITNKEYKYIVCSQIEELGCVCAEKQVLVEPEGKNTLPAICFGVRSITDKDDDTVIVLPSDHMIGSTASFVNDVKMGKVLTEKYLVTFGIIPHHPDTAYGYIVPGKELIFGYKVRKFTEKPARKTAEKYIKRGCLWNSGMFMFKSRVFWSEVKKHCPEVIEAFKAASIEEVYERLPAISIDYGLMEKSNKKAVIPFTTAWSDLGSFDSLLLQYTGDEKENINLCNAVVKNSAKNFIYSNSGKAIALIGMEDTIIIDEADALLVCKKGSSQRVKEVVESLKKRKDSCIDFHPTCYKPWGYYTVLAQGATFKIKTLTILQGKQLSYQLHHHRSEYWVVLEGAAKVTRDDEEFLVVKGESINIKCGVTHRVENPGKIPLQIIELQLGEYLEEDDIVRFIDEYGRK